MMLKMAPVHLEKRQNCRPKCQASLQTNMSQGNQLLNQ